MSPDGNGSMPECHTQRDTGFISTYSLEAVLFDLGRGDETVCFPSPESS